MGKLAYFINKDGTLSDFGMSKIIKTNKIYPSQKPYHTKPYKVINVNE
jgi:hypothetical protein